VTVKAQLFFTQLPYTVNVAANECVSRGTCEQTYRK